LIGNLGKDPEVRSTANGSKVATLSVATSRRWKSQAGEDQEKTEWHRVILWNNSRGSGLADVAERYLKKGDRIYVEGRIDYRTWEDKEGNTRYSTEIVGREMMMLSGRSGGEDMEPVGASVGEVPSAQSGSKSFSDFPDALDEEDEDLPF
jgi:single-strand DNA-binding protein